MVASMRTLSVAPTPIPTAALGESPFNDGVLVLEGSREAVFAVVISTLEALAIVLLLLLLLLMLLILLYNRGGVKVDGTIKGVGSLVGSSLVYTREL